MSTSFGAVLAVCFFGSPLAIATPDPSFEPGLEPPTPAFDADGSKRSSGRLGNERDRDPYGWLVPDFAKLQSGGFVGLLTAGVGYGLFDDLVNLGAHYGYTPPAQAGQDVHTLHFTLDLRPLELRFGHIRWLPAYLGGGLLYVWGDQYFTDVPDRYAAIDPSYYPPTSLHWTAHLGTELDWLPRSGFFERHGLYYELATLDTFAFAYLENRGTVELTEVLASTFGYRAAW